MVGWKIGLFLEWNRVWLDGAALGECHASDPKRVSPEPSGHLVTALARVSGHSVQAFCLCASLFYVCSVSPG